MHLKCSLFLETFSLLGRLGNCMKGACGTVGFGHGLVCGSPETAEFPVKSLLAGNCVRDGCDQHCVASQAARVSENFRPNWRPCNATTYDSEPIGHQS